jgi:hypothetical protein
MALVGLTSLWFTTSYVTFRILGIAAAAVVAGIVGTHIAHTANAHAYVDSRIIYTIVIAGLNLWDGLTFIIPFNVFPNDFIFFVLWIVDTTLLLRVSILPSLKLRRISRESNTDALLTDRWKSLL